MNQVLRFGGWRTGAALAALALAAILFALVFGASARRDAIAQAREQANRRAALEIGTLVADVEKFRVLPFVLVELPDVRGALVDRDPAAETRLNATLKALAIQTGATVFYAIDRAGVARSASNADGPDSFAGFDFRTRPYFLDALRTGGGEYFAEGRVTGRPGLFLARRAGPVAAPEGVIVVKIEFDRIERLWRSAGQTSLVVDRDGIVVIGTDAQRRFRTLRPLPPARREAILRSGQFGRRSLRSAGLVLEPGGLATDSAGQRYIAVVQALPILGWRHIHLEPLGSVIEAANARVRVATLAVILILSALAAAIAWSATRSRRAEAARRALEKEVDRRTAELTDAYDRLRCESDERALADGRYRAAREELAQANRLGSIGTITTSVAHELNQPVAAIRTASENGLKLLRRDRPEDVASNLSLIVSLTERIGAITGELLSYGRRGRADQTMVPLDEILDGALMLVGDSFRRGRVRLDVVREAGLPRIRASRIRMEQVLVNLRQNALDAIDGAPEPRVRLEARAEPGGQVRLTVEDNGPGIPPDLHDAIFQPFFTGKRDGTGLGLGISREIVEDHGGRLTVGTESLGGASFHVVLPRDGKPT